jgi:hypothetical protein
MTAISLAGPFLRLIVTAVFMMLAETVRTKSSRMQTWKNRKIATVAGKWREWRGSNP